MQEKLKNLDRRLTIQSDDPFVEMFMNSEEREMLKFQETAETLKRRHEFKHMMRGVSTDLTNRYNLKRQETKEGQFYWQTPAYYQLSVKRRQAIDMAKHKSQHSDFWYQLQTLNDKISVFRGMYYDKLPHYDQNYYNRKQKLHNQTAEQLKIMEEADSPSKVTSSHNSNHRGHSAHARSSMNSARAKPCVPSPIKINKKDKYPLSERYVQRVKANTSISKRTQDKKANTIISQEFSTNSNSERLHSERSGKKYVKVDMTRVNQIQEVKETDEGPVSFANLINQQCKSGSSSPQAKRTKSHERLDMAVQSIGISSGQVQSRNKIKISDLLHDSMKDEPKIKQKSQNQKRHVKLENDRITIQIKELEKRRMELNERESVNLQQILRKSQELIDMPITQRGHDSPSKKSKKFKLKKTKTNFTVIPPGSIIFQSQRSPLFQKDPKMNTYHVQSHHCKSPQLKKFNHMLQKNSNLKPYFSPDPKQLNKKSEQYKFWMLANAMKILKNSYPKNKKSKQVKVTYIQDYNVLHQGQGICAVGQRRANSSFV